MTPNRAVAQTTGGPVLLRDVATVLDTYKQQTQLQRLNGASGTRSVGKSGPRIAIETGDDEHAVFIRWPRAIARMRPHASLYSIPSSRAAVEDGLSGPAIHPRECRR